MKKLFYIFCILTVFSASGLLEAKENSFSDKPKKIISLRTFEGIPLLEDGRIKPLDTYARNVLLRFSGRRSFERKPAMEWLVRLLFDPVSTRQDKVFLINNPEIAVALGINPEEKRRYSFTQLEKGYHKLEELNLSASRIEEKKRSVVENEIVRLASNVDVYLQLSQSLQFAKPHPDFEIRDSSVVAYLELPEGKTQFSFLDLALRADLIRIIVDPLERKDAVNWSSFEREIFRLLASLYQWSMNCRGMPLRIIPPFLEGEEAWLSPWGAISTGFSDEGIREEIIFLNEMTSAFQRRQQVEFDLAARKFIHSVQNRTSDGRAMKLLNLEVLYNKLNLFVFARLFYFLALLMVMMSFFRQTEMLRTLALSAVFLGFVPHLFALATRIIILGRPPITSLYETFIFVGFITVLIGIVIEAVQKKWLGILVSSICGTILLAIAGRFSADGDTLKMLVAVLNSNFWLSIHVPNITMGYSACTAAGIIGHIYILQALFRPSDRKQLEATYKVLVGVLGLGLTLAALGTTLGGIWADQSWGRFWGWDPKENGALMIVLWCAIIFHARVAGLIGPLGFAAASAFGMIVVTWAWFGVNLLSVGLHSYGFTSGVAVGLAAYVVMEIVFLLISVPLAYKNLKK